MTKHSRPSQHGPCVPEITALCPFCKMKTSLWIHVESREYPDMATEWDIMVMCLGCHTRGPQVRCGSCEDAQREAIRLWNSCAVPYTRIRTEQELHPMDRRGIHAD